METENLHTLKWLSGKAGMPMATLYRKVNNKSIPVIIIDGVRLVDTSLPEVSKLIKNEIH